MATAADVDITEGLEAEVELVLHVHVIRAQCERAAQRGREVRALVDPRLDAGSVLRRELGIRRTNRERLEGHRDRAKVVELIERRRLEGPAHCRIDIAAAALVLE